MNQNRGQKLWDLIPESAKTKIEKVGKFLIGTGVIIGTLAARAVIDHEHQKKQNAIRIFVIAALQVAILFLIIFICLKLGVTAWLWLTAAILYLACCAGFGFYIWNVSVRDRWLKYHRGTLVVSSGITILVYALILWAIFIRRFDQFGWPVIAFASILFCAPIASYYFDFKSILVGYTSWISWAVSTTVLAFSISWSLGTIVSRHELETQLIATSTEDREAEFRRRESCANNPIWKKKDGSGITISLLLSGGGYRAALIHAGLLDVFDKHCIPIKFLSTVSGGSIVGTYYSLGNSPSRFKNQLMKHIPGLPDEMFAIDSLLHEWLAQSWTNADTYAAHFRRVFFGKHTLNDTHERPVLLINATDIEREAKSSREIFFQIPDKTYSALNDTKLADLVAASGAYPGAFQPKRVKWFPSSGYGAPGYRYFLDGGIVENLGLSGLIRYSDVYKLGKKISDTDIIIVSDASKRGRAKNLPPRVGLVTLITKSLDISGDLYLESIRKSKDLGPAIYITFDSDDEETTKCFASLTFSSATVPPANGLEVASEVAAYETLKELLPEEVEKAYWVGQVLGSRSWYKVKHIREELTGQKGNPEKSCPTQEEVTSAR